MSAEKIDHAAEAKRILSDPVNMTAEYNDPHGAALAHATLALAEQQRVANLIALGLSAYSPEIQEGLGL